MYRNTPAACGTGRLPDLSRQLQPCDGAVMNNPTWTRRVRIDTPSIEDRGAGKLQLTAILSKPDIGRWGLRTVCRADGTAE